MTTPATTSPRASASAARWGLFQVTAAAVLWGTGGLVVQLIREDEPFSPLTLSAVRMLIGAAALLAVVTLARKAGEVARVLRAHPVAAVLTGCGTGIYQGLYFVAVTHAGVAVATVVSLGLAPIITAGYEVIRHRNWPSPRLILILVIALAGLVLVAVPLGGIAVGPRPTSGVLLSVASGTVYAATTIVGAHAARGTAPLALTTVATCSGAVLLAPLLWVAPGPLVPETTGVAAWLVYLGVGTMALSYLLLYAGLRTVRAGVAVIASLLEPVTAAMLAWLVLDEQLGASAVIGTMLVLAAVAGLGSQEGRPRLEPTPRS
ncbi:MAG: DMT family transporter [Nocardioides sp.]